ncbi:cytochrome P450 734A1-like [Solanum tuberosum]|uniref:cytochrome P450 734A1-like n=1 Tax=Solanum tuberosum TaxID=4113 RepID=UPI0003D240C5|nr:PREDICTED: cytochrome P450 734A1-like [Solanum tuberosum]
MEDYWLCYLIIFWFVLLIVQKVVINLCWRPRRIQNHFLKQGIRGPKYNFLLGNLKEIADLQPSSSQHFSLSHDIVPRVFSFYHHWKNIYGATFLVWFGPTVRVSISDPTLIRDIFLVKSDNFEKIETPPSAKKLEGDGLSSLRGEKWAHHRKILTQTFYSENLKLMIPTMGKSMKDMLTKWSSKMSKDGKVEIEVSEWFLSLSEEVITHTVFGSSYEDGKAIFELQAQQLVYATNAFHQLFIPGFRFLPTKKNIISWKLDKDVRNSLMKLIEHRKKSLECDQSEEGPKDLLEVMIKASNSTYSNSAIKVDDIVEECKTMFLAGKYTTSNLLTWTTILLAMNPHWQQLARDEVFNVCGARDTPSKDNIAKLKTLGMILNESLRLYPPLAATIRRAKIDTTLGTLNLPQGTELLIPFIGIHHDAELWGDDVNEFNPGRFARGVAQAAKSPMAFMPFGLGARHCIGQNLAIIQAKLAIAMMLMSFSFELAPTYQHAPTILIFLCPQYGAPIIFKKL